MTRMWARFVAILITGVFASYGVAAVTVGSLPDPASAAATTLAGDQLYVFPQSQQTAMYGCVQDERTAREIPGDVAGYTAWYEANRGSTAVADWDAAWQRCYDRSYTTALFDFAHLVRAH